MIARSKFRPLIVLACMLTVMLALYCIGNVEADAVTYSGSCGADGSDVSWSLDTDSGKLTISGTGDMADYDVNVSSKRPPWYVSYRSYITSIEIGSGVTSIGDYAFTHCSNVTSVTISDTVTKIGASAFTGCSNLPSITIPNSVTCMEDYVFMHCYLLADVTIPDSVTVMGRNVLSNTAYYNNSENWINDVLYAGNHLIVARKSVSGKCIVKTKTKTIADYAFYECGSLTGAALPSTVAYIGNYAFFRCSAMTSANIPNSTKAIGTCAFAYCDKLTELTVGNGVTSIGDSAFSNCTSLTKLVLGNSVAQIGNMAFEYCYLLSSIVIPDSVTVMGASLFYACDSLESLTLPFVGPSRSVAEGTKESWFGYMFGAYYNYTNGYNTQKYWYNNNNYIAYNIPCSLKSITITDSVINSNSFNACGSLTTVTLGDGVTEVKGSAFRNCGNISNLYIGSGVKAIGSEAFSFVDAVHVNDIISWIGISLTKTSFSAYTLYINGEPLTTLILPDYYNGESYAISNAAFYSCHTLTEVYVGKGVTSIGAYAFANCTNLNKITFGDNVSSIGERAFYYCTSLVTVELPDNLTEIGKEAFYQCKELTDINFGSSVSKIGEYVFYGCEKLTSVTIPDSVTEIERYAFAYCPALSYVTLGNSLKTVGDRVFYECNVKTVNITDVAMWCTVSFGNESDIVRYYGAELYLNGEPLTELIIPDGVTTVRSYAFYELNTIKKIVIPGTVTDMGDYAFAYCDLLETVIVKDGGASIGDCAFYYCSSIKEVVIGNGTTEIGEVAFYHCSNLKTVSLGEGLITIENEAFSQCDSLESINIPASVTKIESNAFYSCDGLNSVYITDIVKWCQITFDNSSANPLAYAKYLYVNGKLITELVIPEGVTTLPEYAFSCENITSVKLPNSLTSFGSYAFYNCTGLKNVTVPEGITTISSRCFAGCSSLESITLPNTLTTIGTYAFSRCAQLTSITVGSNVKSIGSYAFSDCYRLVEVINLSSLKITVGTTTNGYVGYYAIEVHDQESKIDNQNGFLFYYYNGIGYLIGGSNVSENLILPSYYNNKSYYINDYAFYSNEDIVTLVIPNNVIGIGDYAFKYCTGILSVTLGKDVREIGTEAFYYCSYLIEVVNHSSLNIVPGSASYGEIALNATSVTKGDSEVVKYGDYLFYSHNGTIYLLKYLGSDKAPVLPESYNGKTYAIYKNAFATNTDIQIVVIPGSVTAIGEQAFEGCSSLKKITIGSGVKTIGSAAFSGCSALTSVVIPGNVTTIGSWAFNRCTALKSVTVSEGVTTISYQAFYGCSSLQSVTFPSTVTTLGQLMFGECSKLETLVIPFVGANANASTANNTTLFGYLFSTSHFKGSYAAQQYYNTSKSVTYYIPSSLKSVTILGGDILYGAFYGCKNLEEIVIGEGVVNIGKYAFYDCSALKSLTIGNGVKSFNDAFPTTIPLESLYISDLATWCGISFSGLGSNPIRYAENVYVNGKLITAIAIPDSVTSIGQYAFAGFDSLTAVTIGKNVTSIGMGAFYECTGLTSINIPNNVQSLGSMAFYSCSGIKTIVIGVGVNSINYSSFYKCTSVEKITVHVDNTAYRSLNGHLYTKDAKKLIMYAPANPATEFSLPSYVNELDYYAFNDCVNLKTVIITSSGLTSIPAGVFKGCSNLENMTLPFAGSTKDMTEAGYNSLFGSIFGGSSYDNSVEIKQFYAPNKSYTFHVPASLKSVTILGGNMLRGAFMNCSMLTSVTIGDNVTGVGSDAFQSCTGLLSVTVGKKVTALGDHAFAYCSSLTDVTLSDKLTTIGNSAFTACSSLVNINLGSSLKTIGNYVFEGCTSLVELNLPDSLESIGDNAFCNCDSIERLVIPKNVTSMGFGPIQVCDKLTEVVILAEITELPDNCFQDCPALKSVILPESLTTVSDSAFRGCTGLTEITIPDSVTTIGVAVFRGCSSLEKITLGVGLRDVGRYSFEECPSLNAVCITDIVAWCQISFYDAPTNPLYYAENLYLNGELLTDLVLPDEVTIVPYYAFRNCKSIRSITVSGGVTELGNYSFAGCTNLKTVYVSPGVKRIGLGCFSGCSALESMTLPFIGRSSEATSRSMETVFGYIFGTNNYEGSYYAYQYYNTGYSYYTYYIPTSLNSVTVLEGKLFYGAFDNCNISNIYICEQVTCIEPNAFTFNGEATTVTFENPMGWLVDGEPVDWNALLTPNGIKQAFTSTYPSCTWTKTPVTLYELNNSIKWCILDSGRLVIYGQGAMPNFTAGKAPWAEAKDSITAIGLLGISSIGNCAFYNFNTITDIDFPGTVTAIGDYAFFGCTGLTQLNIPDTILSIGKYAFRKCSSLNSVFISNVAGWTADGTYLAPRYLVYPDIAAKYLVSDYYTSTWTRNPSGTTDITLLDSGECGENAYWALSSTGELRIYGSGAIADYSAYGTPWRSYNSTITTVTVCEGITAIGAYAFDRCKFTSISLPATLKTIGEYAFNMCDSFKKLNIPKSVYSIASTAFMGCKGIEAITADSGNLTYIASRNCLIHVKSKTIVLGCNNSLIAKDTSITAIGPYAFSNYGKSTLNIPSTITRIGDYAFFECFALTEIKLPNGTVEIGEGAFYYCTNLASISLGNTITTIGANAFSSCYAITEITLPKSLTVIGENAFCYCSKLKSIVVPDSVVSIGKAAFGGCKALESMTLPFVGASRDPDTMTKEAVFGYIFTEGQYSSDTYTTQYSEGGTIGYFYIPPSLKTVTITSGKIAKGGFMNCKNLTTVTLGNNVTSIGPSSFIYSGLVSISLPEGLEEIPFAAFESCRSLRSISIPNSVTSIGNRAFHDCKGLQTVVIGNGVKTIGDYAFFQCGSITSLTLGEGLEEIGYAAFAQNKMTALVIPDSVTYISGEVFANCDLLKTVTIGDGKITIDYAAFYDCNALTTVNLGSNVSVIGDSAFYSCNNLTSITLGDSITTIGSKAFAYTSIKSVYIGRNVTAIGIDVFYKSSMASATFANPIGWSKGENTIHWSELIDSTDCARQLYTRDIALTRSVGEISGELGEGIVWEFAYGNTLIVYGSGEMPKLSAGKAPWNEYKDSITDIVILGVSSIGNSAFYGLDKVTAVHFLDDSVKTISDYAFFGCASLTEMTVPASVTSIGKYAFRKCSSLLKLNLEAIAGWTADGTYVAPAQLVFADLAAEYFVDTDYMKAWTRNPKGTTSVAIAASGDCGNGVYWILSTDNILRVYGNGVIPDYQQGTAPWYSYMSAVRSVTVAKGITHVGDYAFYGCGAPTVTISNNVRSIGSYAFANSAFTSVTFSVNLNTIEEYAFKDAALNKLSIPKSVTQIAPGAFYGCSALVSITVDSANTIYRGSYNCIVEIKTRSIILGCRKSTVAKDTAITTIGKYAFAGSGVTTVKLPSTITKIDEGAFMDCKSLTVIDMSDLVTSIESYAFSGSGLTTFTIPTGVKVISDGVFKDCTALGYVSLSNNVITIESNAFRGCTALTSFSVPASVRTIEGGAFVESGIITLKLISPTDWLCDADSMLHTTLYNSEETAKLFKNQYSDELWTRDPGQTFPVNDTFGWEITKNGELFIYGVGCMPEYAAGKAPWTAYKDQYTAVILSEGLTSVGKSAFYGLTNITSVSLPESIMVIEDYAFFGCSGIKSIRIPAKVYTIGAYAMRKTAFTELVFANPEGWSVNGLAMGEDMTVFAAYLSGGKVNGVATTEYKYAFRRADNSEGNVLDGGSIANGAITWSLSDTGLLVITGSGNIPNFTATGSPWYQYRNIIRRIVISEGITAIGRSAFYTCGTLESVVIPSTVQTIGGYAFYKCTSLLSLNIPEAVIKIEAFAFRQCGVKSLDLAIKYGWSAGGQKFSASELATGAADYLATGYYKYEWVRDVNAEYEDADPNYADGGMCNANVKWKVVWLDEAKTMMKLTVYGSGAMPGFGTGGAPWYQYLDMIVEIEVGEGITEIGRCAFYNLNKVTKVTLHEGLITIGAYSFNTCKALKEIDIPDSVTSIDDTAFKKSGLAVLPKV